ncbi:MAG: hypothetical protein GC157_17490 [Frankiales bacterium]|nr:hypothetical protein [Frankiales bacterium]
MGGADSVTSGAGLASARPGPSATDPDRDPDTPGDRRRPGRRAAALVLAVVLLAVVGVLGWTWASSRGDGPAAPSSSGPVLLTHDGLAGVVASSGHAVYWAGPRGLARWEVTVDGTDVYVRYLPEGERPGSRTPYLTIGTYENADAYAVVQAAAKAAGAQSQRLAGGALVVAPAATPDSVFFAFPGTPLLMEVFDPTPGRALALVRSGDVQPLA